jgi:hypothetical protein
LKVSALELQWHDTQQQLIAAAQRAKGEIKSGLAKPMDYEEL